MQRETTRSSKLKFEHQRVGGKLNPSDARKTTRNSKLKFEHQRVGGKMNPSDAKGNDT